MVRLFRAAATSGRDASARCSSSACPGNAGSGRSGGVTSMSPSMSRSWRSALTAVCRPCCAIAICRCADLIAVSARSTSTFVTSPAS